MFLLLNDSIFYFWFSGRRGEGQKGLRRAALETCFMKKQLLIATPPF
jgi:hypothetical protein